MVLNAFPGGHEWVRERFPSWRRQMHRSRRSTKPISTAEAIYARMASRSLSVPRSRSGIRRPPSGRLRVVRFHRVGDRRAEADVRAIPAADCDDRGGERDDLLRSEAARELVEDSSGAPGSGSRVRASHQASAARLPVQKHSASRQTATMSRRYRSHRAHAPQRRVRPNGVGAAADLRGSDLDQSARRGDSEIRADGWAAHRQPS